MRRTFLILFAIFVSFFLSASEANAQFSFDQTRMNVGIMGVNCGVPNTDPAVNKCCIAFDASLQITSADPLLGQVTGALNNAVNGATLDKVNNAAKFVQQNFGGATSYCQAGSNPVPADPFTDPINCKCKVPDQQVIPSAEKLCALLGDAAEQDACRECMNTDPNSTDRAGVWSGIGCVKTNLAEFVQETVFGMIIGIAGMAALLCIIYCAFQLQLSQNNPEKIKETQELLTSCITGLILILFSIFILRIIGVDLLRIPGFS